MSHVSWLWAQPHHIADVLKRLQAILDAGQRVGYPHHEKLTKLLDRVPPGLSEEVHRFRKLLDAAEKI